MTLLVGSHGLLPAHGWLEHAARAHAPRASSRCRPGSGSARATRCSAAGSGSASRCRSWRWPASGRAPASRSRRCSTSATRWRAAASRASSGTTCCSSAGCSRAFLPRDRRGEVDPRPVPAAPVQAVLRVGARQAAVAHRRLARRQRDALLLRDRADPDGARLVRAPPARLVAPHREQRDAGVGAGRALPDLRAAARAHRGGRGVHGLPARSTSPPPTTASSPTWRWRSASSCSTIATSSGCAPSSRRARGGSAGASRRCAGRQARLRLLVAALAPACATR